MSTSEKHQSQYESNRDFINELLSSHTSKNDWIITAAFYSALHLVDKTIIDAAGEAFKPTSHKNRNEKVGGLANFKDIRREYIALYFDSRKSRYDCVTISDQNKNDAMMYLEAIEKKLVT